MARVMARAPNLLVLVVCLCLHASVVLSDPEVQSDEITLEWRQIVVNVMDDGPTFSLMVEPDQITLELARDIYELEGIPDGPMKPKLGETVMNNTRRLSDYNICEQTILTVYVYDTVRSNRSVKFYVKTLAGRELQVTTELGNSVASLKNKITQWAGIPQTEQRLLCNGKELRDERKLLHYDIEYDTVLTLGRPLENCRQMATIFVKTLSGAAFEVEVDLADTVLDLKEKIWDRTNIPASAQRLSFDRRMIAGVDHLCDLGLEAGSTVYMYLYSARITSPDQVARLREPPVNRQVDPYKAPIFREAVAGESVKSGRRGRFASLYKDSRNWVARDEHRPFSANDLFDPVAHLSPNPDYDLSMETHYKTLKEVFSRPKANEKQRLSAVLYRVQLKLSSAVRPYRQAANLTSATYSWRCPGITLGGWSTNVDPERLVPVGADPNNWAPDAFSDSDVMRLFEVAERVRQTLARAAQTGEGILSVASQRRINNGILLTYYEALVGYPPLIEYEHAREDEECGICIEKLVASGPAVELPCKHVFHSDCVYSWVAELIQAHRFPNYRFPSCPFCRKMFMFPYEVLGKAELRNPELQSNRTSENVSVHVEGELKTI